MTTVFLRYNNARKRSKKPPFFRPSKGCEDSEDFEVSNLNALELQILLRKLANGPNFEVLEAFKSKNSMQNKAFRRLLGAVPETFSVRSFVRKNSFAIPRELVWLFPERKSFQIFTFRFKLRSQIHKVSL